jgi:hypothetical protein
MPTRQTLKTNGPACTACSLRRRRDACESSVRVRPTTRWRYFERSSFCLWHAPKSPGGPPDAAFNVLPWAADLLSLGTAGGIERSCSPPRRMSLSRMTTGLLRRAFPTHRLCSSLERSMSAANVGTSRRSVSGFGRPRRWPALGVAASPDGARARAAPHSLAARRCKGPHTPAATLAPPRIYETPFSADLTESPDATHPRSYTGAAGPVWPARPSR